MKVWMLKTKRSLDKYRSELQFAFSIGEQLLSSYKGSIIEVLEDDGGTTAEFGIINGVLDTASLLAFVGVNNGYVVGIYDQKSGVKTAISTSAQQILIVNAGSLVSYTAKYLLEIPQNTALTVSGIASCNRMKNLNMVNYIAFKGAKTISGYSADYVFPINCSAGLMDFGWTNLSNIFWYLVGGTTSTNARPGSTLDAGVSYSFGTNIKSTGIILNANSTGVKMVGDLADLPKITYQLNLNSCTNTTGNISELANIVHYISLYFLSNLIGQIESLNANIANTLNLTNLNKITGSINHLAGIITFNLNLVDCSLLTGAYIPTIANTPDTSYFNGTNMSASDVDNTLIAYAAITNETGKSIYGTGLTRTSASDAAIASLESKSWTITGITRV